MFETFEQYIKDKVSISTKDLEHLRSTSEIRRLTKGEHLLKEGEVWKWRAFIIKGLLRTYRTDNNGNEHTIRFAMEDWWVGDGESYHSGEPSVYNIDTLENSEVLLWKRNHEF